MKMRDKPYEAQKQSLKQQNYLLKRIFGILRLLTLDYKTTDPQVSKSTFHYSEGYFFQYSNVSNKRTVYNNRTG